MAARGYEPVVEQLARMVDAGTDVGAAVCVYHRGEKVVDAWTGEAAPGKPWRQENLAVIFSAGKGAVALMAQILFDRGDLEVDVPVTRYWPEFGQAGKEKTTVRMLLSHTSGVLTFPNYWEILGRDSLRMTDWELMVENLAASPSAWPPGSTVGYHAITYGHLVGEVIRRVSGRTPGQFLAEEIAGPLGIDVHIGFTGDNSRVADAMPAGPNPIAIFEDGIQAAIKAAQDALRSTGAYAPAALATMSPIFLHPDRGDIGPYLTGLFNNPVVRAAEIPGSNGVGDARGLARMYAAVACGGELDGVRLVGEASIEEFTTRQPTSTDLMPFALGYARLQHLLPPGAAGRPFGHGGAGGTLGFGDRDNNFAFGFTHNQMRDDLLTVPLAQVAYRCAGIGR